MNTPHLLAVTGAVLLPHLGNVLHEALTKLLLQLVVFQVEDVGVSGNPGIDDSTHCGIFALLAWHVT